MNDFNIAGDALLAYGAQVSGYPKVIFTDGTKSTLSPYYTLTASNPDGTTNDVDIYNIQTALRVTGDATVTNTVGTPDIIKFAFAKKKICNLIRVNEVAHDLSTVAIEVSNDGAAWTPITAKNIQAHDTHYDLEFTNNTGYFYYRFTLADLTSIATSEVDIYLNDRTVKIESAPDIGNGDDAGEVRFYKANISGFDGTVTDIVAAGWTQITGTSDLGQSATELAVIDNGLVRVVLNKNRTGTLADALRVYNFNGAAWVETYASQNTNDTHTITSVSKNTPREVAVGITYTVTGNPFTMTAAIEIKRGIPVFSIALESYDGTGLGTEFAMRLRTQQHIDGHTTYIGNDASAVFASDSYGLQTNDNIAPAADGWYSFPAAADGLALLISQAQDESLVITRGAATVATWFSIVSGDLPEKHWLGAVPMTYTVPSTLDAEVGNTDGQLIEAESFYAWEGETPLIGTNLLTNGGFDTNTDGWAPRNGSTLTRVTSDKKFGAASLEVTRGSGDEATAISPFVDVVEGDTYALTGWVKNIDATSCRLEVAFRNSGGTFVAGAESAAVPGHTWTYVNVTAVAPATGVKADVFLNVIGATGKKALFDGIQLIKVKDAAGVSALAFDTTSTAGWTLEANASSLVGGIDAPRGKGVQWNATTGGFVGGRLDFPDASDLSDKRYLSAWVKTTASGARTKIAIRNGGVDSTPVASAFFTGADTWNLAVLDISGVPRTEVTRITIWVSDTTATRTDQFANIRLSKHNPAIGQKHGLLHDMGDAEGLAAWFKLGDVATGSELVTNGGFETYTTSPGVPDSWATINGLGATAPSKETTIVRTGSNAVKLTIDGSGSRGIGQTLSGLSTGKSYYVEAWARTDGVAGSRPRLGIRNTTDAVNIALIDGTDAGTTYEKLALTFYNDGGDTYQIQLTQVGGAGGEVIYFDDITVKEIVATDSSGNANTGTLRGATNTAGPTIGVSDPFGGTSAMDFDGVDDYVSVPDADSLDVTTAFTLEVWVNHDTVGAAQQDILDKNSSSFGPKLTMSSSNWRFGINDFSAGNRVNAAASTGWHHLTGTFDSGSAKLYVDGTLAVSATLTDSAATANAFPLFIGSDGGTGNFFDGRIAGVRVYNRALGADEVAQRYNTRTHEAVAGIKYLSGTATLNLNTALAKEGSKALDMVFSSTGTVDHVFPSPQDFSKYQYLEAWAANTSGSSLNILLVDSTGAISSTLSLSGLAPSMAFGRVDITTATGVDLTSIAAIRFTASSKTVTLDGLKLTSLNEVGDWRFLTNANSSGGYSIQSGAAPSTTTLAANDKFTVPVTIPNAGKYYVGVMAKATHNVFSTDGFIEATLDGVASGAPKAVLTTALNVQENQLLFGPFTVGAGEKNLEIKVSTLGSMTALEVDFMDLFPYERTASSATQIFPKDFSNSMLKDVTKLGSS